MNSWLKTFAYAKINLGLAVNGQRKDGYHDIESVFQSIDLHDVVRLRPVQEGISCRCGDLSGPANLAYRAAARFLRELEARRRGRLRGVEIEIEKNIPMEAGLAGGSSDGAAVLKLMNQLYEYPFSLEELNKMGAELGADVVFCLNGGTMWAAGRGELLEQLPPAPRLDLVVVKPQQGVSTQAAYGRLAQMGKWSTLERKKWEKILAAGERESIAKLLSNDLEPPSFQLVPEISCIKKELLRHGSLGALMSGSGSAVFGIGKNAEHVRQIGLQIKKQGYAQVWVTHTINKGEQERSTTDGEKISTGEAGQL